MTEKHNSRTCLRCAFLRSVERKYPNWPVAHTQEGAQDIMHTLATISGYMLASMENADRIAFLTELRENIKRYERIADNIEEQVGSIH